MENEIDNEKFLQAFKAFFLNHRINDYAIERVAFGYEKPGDPAPIDLYLEHIRLDLIDFPNDRRLIPGMHIDEQERISAEHDRAELVRDLFVSQMEQIFWDAPRDAALEREAEELPLLPRFREYVFGLLPMFSEVLNVEVEHDVFDLIPTDRAKRSAEYSKWKMFVTAILLKPLRLGSRIDRHVKDITHPPHYVRALIEKRGKHFYLKPVDIDSYEYIFALFSLMLFINDENDRLLELKMLEWERRHKSE